MQRHGWTRLIGVTAFSAGAFLGGASAAQADPPPGWEPGDGGVEYELADTIWSHHGRYDGHLGNWHTGWVNIEEDDDVLTGELVDWWCPAGVEPPTAYSPDPDTPCKQRGELWLEYIQYFDVATFDQARNRLDVHMDVPAYVDGIDPAGTVRVDLMMRGRGVPTVQSDDSNDILTYSEFWYDVKTWGRVDGQRINGTNTVNDTYIMGFTLDSWERTT
jgi:hypothetical protein